MSCISKFRGIVLFKDWTAITETRVYLALLECYRALIWYHQQVPYTARKVCILHGKFVVVSCYPMIEPRIIFSCFEIFLLVLILFFLNEVGHRVLHFVRQLRCGVTRTMATFICIYWSATQRLHTKYSWTR